MMDRPDRDSLEVPLVLAEFGFSADAATVLVRMLHGYALSLRLLEARPLLEAIPRPLIHQDWNLSLVVESEDLSLLEVQDANAEIFNRLWVLVPSMKRADAEVIGDRLLSRTSIHRAKVELMLLALEQPRRCQVVGFRRRLGTEGRDAQIEVRVDGLQTPARRGDAFFLVRLN